MLRVNFLVLICTFVLAVSLSSCLSSHSERVVDVNALGWTLGDTLELKINNQDTVSLRNICVIARVDDSFEEYSLPISMAMYSPDSLSFDYDVDLSFANTEPVEYSSGMRDYHVEIMAKTRLAKEGDYIVKFAPRADKIIGLWALGLKFDK